MKIKEDLGPQKRYECLGCGSLINIDVEADSDKIKCCTRPNLKLIMMESQHGDNYDLGKIYEGVIEALKYYIDTPEKNYKLLAVWIISTYFQEEFPTFPILFFNAMKGSAKTRTSKLVNYLSKGGDGTVTNSLTEATLFRHPPGQAMGLDEIENIGGKEMSNIRELLNAVYKKGAAIKRYKKVKKAGEENYEVEVFQPYFPVTLANIWGIEEVLEDRAFTVVLEKSSNPLFTAIIEDWSERDEIKLLKRTLEEKSVVSVVKLRKKMYIRGWNDFIKNTLTTQYTYNTHNTLTTLNKQQTKEEERQFIEEKTEKEELFLKLLNSGISGRNLELSFPLLITARFISDDLFLEIMDIVKEFVIEKKENEYMGSKDVVVYQAVSELKGGVFETYSVKELCMLMRRYVGDEDWLNEKWLGRALKRLNLVLSKKRSNQGIYVQLNIAKAKEKLGMFGPPNEKTSGELVG